MDLKILFCIVLGLLFNMIMCLVMIFLQFFIVCLEVILQASILVVHPMLASSPTHCCTVKLSCGVGGRMIFVRVCSCCMCGWVIQVRWSWVLIMHTDFLTRWYVFRCCFQTFCCLWGRKPPCW